MLKNKIFHGVIHERHDEFGDFSVYIGSISEFWEFADLFYEEVIWRSGRDIRDPHPATLSNVKDRAAKGSLYLNIEDGENHLEMGNSMKPEYHPVFTMESLLAIRKLQPISDSKWEELLWT
jgi:hypothetical protein